MSGETVVRVYTEELGWTAHSGDRYEVDDYVNMNIFDGDDKVASYSRWLIVALDSADNMPPGMPPLRDAHLIRDGSA